MYDWPGRRVDHEPFVQEKSLLLVGNAAIEMHLVKEKRKMVDLSACEQTMGMKNS
jgi:hypothetical protein